MKKRIVMIVLCLVTAVASSMTLTRCGSGLGKLVDSNANGMKF